MLAVAALQAAVVAWLTTSQEQGDLASRSLAALVDSHGALNRVWPMPSEPFSTRGLGGGLTFAYDPSICDELLPAFSESDGLWGVSFVDCESIKAAIRSAFASWSANHPMLKFHDVTADCLATNDLEGGPMGVGCSRAEIWLSTTTNTTSQDAAATTINEFTWDGDFHHPSGVRAMPGLYATSGSIIRFARSHGVCWYMDSSFCEGFHRWKREFGPDAVLLLGRLGALRAPPPSPARSLWLSPARCASPTRSALARSGLRPPWPSPAHSSSRPPTLPRPPLRPWSSRSHARRPPRVSISRWPTDVS